MIIREVKNDKKQYIDFLLLADEQENMIDRYLDRGVMYVLDDNGIKAECVVTDEGEGVLEIKNIATAPQYQKKGYAKRLINFLELTYKGRFSALRAGTGDSDLTIPFYKNCGFTEIYRIKNFFIDNYDHPIVENGKRLTDMVVLQKNIQNIR